MSRPVDPEGNERRAIAELVDFTGLDVLEIGCGDGRLTWRYADRAASVLGLDPFEADIARAQAASPDHLRSKVTFRVADALRVGLTDSSFNAVVLARSI
jgi:ubiquinone/menaquinone biosynthesis C-methylase UbiE